MKKLLRAYWPILGIVLFIGIILLRTLWPYDGNITALFHLDRSIGDVYPMPANFVVLDVPGYDGMEYYQMARNVPAFFQPSLWLLLQDIPPGPYAHQRMLLPLAAFLLSLGRDALLPYVFLAINVCAVLGVAVFILGTGKTYSWLYAIALALCPAMMVGLHFSLSEPLAILLLTLFLLRYRRIGSLDGWSILLLSLIGWTREINLLFLLGVTGYSVISKRPRDIVFSLIPLGAFVLLHGLIYLMLDEIPFFWSAEKNTLPLYAIGEILLGKKGFNIYTLSSIALFLLFVFPTLVSVVYEFIFKRSLDFAAVGLFGFLCVMLLMPDHIWGSITSIGRVITPVYPLFIVYALERDTRIVRLIAVGLILIGMATAFGLASISHPFTLT